MVRASLSLYNSKEDVDALTDGLGIEFTERDGSNQSSRTAVIDRIDIDKVVTALATDKPLGAKEVAYAVIKDTELALIKELENACLMFQFKKE